MERSDQIAQYLVSGLSTGAIYALIGIGFAIIYNSTEIINFAQGELVMLGGMFTLYFLNLEQIPVIQAPVHVPLPVAVVLAVAATTATGVLFERVTIRPLRSATPLSLIIITIGVSILIRGIAMLVWGKDT